jgi:hypothetical protein
MMCLFVFACFKRWIVFKWVYDGQVELTRKEEIRADKWEGRAVGLLETAAASAEAAESAVKTIVTGADGGERRRAPRGRG